jgi:hypothetical protein
MRKRERTREDLPLRWVSVHYGGDGREWDGPAGAADNSYFLAGLDRERKVLDDWLAGSEELVSRERRNDEADLPMECSNVVELNLAMARPSGWRNVVLGILIFRRWVSGEVLDPRHATDVCLQLSPEGDEELDALREKHNVEKRDTDVASAQLTLERHNENDQNCGHSCNDKVEHERQPTLHSEEKVEWALAAIKQVLCFLLDEALPSECSDGRQTLQYLVELSV